MNFAYSDDYQPPAPMVGITIGSEDTGLDTGLVSAFVDSGADATIVPKHPLDRMQAPPTDWAFIRSQWGERRKVLLYGVEIRIGNVTVGGINVVGDELTDEIILGRNVLNRLRVLLDGPHKQVQVQP